MLQARFQLITADPLRLADVLKPNEGISVVDSIAANGEHIFSEALHADGSIRQVGDRTFLLTPVGDTTARLTATLRSPQDAKALDFRVDHVAGLAVVEMRFVGTRRDAGCRSGGEQVAGARKDVP